MIIILLGLIAIVYNQSLVTLQQPPLIQTNTYTLRKLTSNITASTTNINFIQHYGNNPQVFTSIASIYTFTAPSTVTFVQKILTVSNTSFTIYYDLICISNLLDCASTFTQIDIVYVAYDYPTYPFIQIMPLNHTIDPSFTLNNQFYQIKYLNSLDPTHDYSINCFLTGFSNLIITGIPTLYINAVYKNKNRYLLNIRFNNILADSLQIVRILIDNTDMNAASTGLNSLACSTGNIYHYQDPLVVQSNATPDFLPFGIFYGIKGFTSWKITIAQMTYLFNNSNPRIQAQIGYTLFSTKSCPSNQLYVNAQNLCYSISAAFYYQASPTALQKCPYSCYQCVGPLSTQCKSCAEGWNRYLNGGRCICITGFYDPGNPICKNCTEAIAGCKTCSSATNCLTCQTGCTAINFNPIYCDCPAHVQNSSTNCPKTFYYEYDTYTCKCYPQTYYSFDAKICMPCAQGCYICVNNASYCLECIDSYTLVNTTCIYFFISYALLGQTSSINSPQLRCLRYDKSNSLCLQKCKRYYYQSNCYYNCPVGTFNITFPWLTCQPCKLNCLHCFNFTVCYKCQPQYFYFNPNTLTCSNCPSNCINCNNSNTCTLCENNYILNSGLCIFPTYHLLTCGNHCNFCLIINECLTCSNLYFLNQTSKLCIQCQNRFGLLVDGSGKCQQICGDGIIVNSACDDMNSISGDGCSSQCKIQDNYQCYRDNNRSYCWNDMNTISWSIFPVMGQNKLIFEIVGVNHLNFSNHLLNFTCSFNSTVTSLTTSTNTVQIKLQYHESILMSNNPFNPKTKNYLLNFNISNNCNLNIDSLRNYTVFVNPTPEPLLINYNSQMQKLLNSKAVQTLASMSVVFGLSTALFGLSPYSSFSSMRVSLLLFISYRDYSQVPLNSYPPLASLQNIIFASQPNSSKSLINFDNNFYFLILWRVCLLYAGLMVLHQFVIDMMLKIVRNMDWKTLNKIFTHIGQNKHLIFQSIYISYEIVIWNIIIDTVANYKQSSPALFSFVIIHIIGIILTKFHFFFSSQVLMNNNPTFLHTMLIDNLQNFTIALLMQFSSPASSFTPVLMILYSVYSLLSLSQSPASAKQSTFNISQTIGIYQYRFNLLILIITQVSKGINMWKSLTNSSQSDYQQLSQVLGLVIGLATYLMLLTNGLSAVITQLIRISQIKHAGEQQLGNNQHISVDLASNIQ